MINYNPNKHDFEKISERIIHFYPIGITTEDSGYFSYPGIQELDKIVVDNIHDANHFKSRWTDFEKEIEEEIQKPVIGTTYGQAPSFSAFVQLETSSMDNFTRTKELHFYISLTGPFYTIIGQDNNTGKFGMKPFWSTNYLVVSPEHEYAEVFEFVAHKIENRFPGYRFVPFGISNQKIEDLYVRYRYEKENTVFNALFNGNVRLSAFIMGDLAYGYDDWIKEDFDGVEEIIVLSPPD